MTRVYISTILSQDTITCYLTPVSSESGITRELLVSIEMSANTQS